MQKLLKSSRWIMLACLLAIGLSAIPRTSASAFVFPSFCPNEDWTSGPFYGSLGTFFADVNGDGRADAIVVNADTVTVRLSTGSSFGPNQDWTQGPYYSSIGNPIYFADVNGDGRADAIVVNPSGSYTVMVRLSTGSGFGPPITSAREGSTYRTYFADVNGDGRADLIALFLGRRATYVNLSTGTGSYSPLTTFILWGTGPYYEFGSGYRATFFADVDGDGLADEIVVNNSGTFTNFSTGNSFGAPINMTNGPYYGSLGTSFIDVTGDGRADAIAVNADTVTVRRACIPG